MFCNVPAAVEPHSEDPINNLAISFQTTTYGKWILTGEHAVVRGHAALVFPFKDQTLNFIVQENLPALTVEIECAQGDTTHMTTLVHRVLVHAAQCAKKSPDDLKGKICIQSGIPPGLGLGSSAALCVAISRWFAAKSWILSTEILQFSRELEHLFHGRSSGLDIAGVNASSAIYFKQGQATPVTMAWQPNWQLTSCGEIGTTAACIHQVNSLWDRQPKVAQYWDDQMNQSVEMAKQALEDDVPSSIEQLKEAMLQGCACFKAWGLVTPALDLHMQKLLDRGALAVKPTGSGGGGMVVSLWASESK